MSSKLVRIIEQRRLGGDQIDDALNRAGRLVLVQPELEVHAHHGEVVAGRGERRSNGLASALPVRLEQAEDRLRIAKDIGRADEAAHRPPHAEHGHLGADRRRRALRIGKLMPVPNRAKRNVVGDHQPDRRFDLLDRRAQHRPVHGRRRNRPVHHVIDLVVLERKHFGQPAADFVERRHRHERLPAVAAGQLRRGHRDGIEIVVAELAGRRAARRVVAEVRAVGVPLAHGRRAGQHRLFRVPRAPCCRTSARRRPLSPRAIFQRLAPQHGRRIRPGRQARSRRTPRYPGETARPCRAPRRSAPDAGPGSCRAHTGQSRGPGSNRAASVTNDRCCGICE